MQNNASALLVCEKDRWNIDFCKKYTSTIMSAVDAISTTISMMNAVSADTISNARFAII